MAISSKNFISLDDRNTSVDILERRSDGVATLTLNRPHRRNAINAETALNLTYKLQKLEGDTEVRALLLQGNNGCFCSGGDIRRTDSPQNRKIERRYADMKPFHDLTKVMTNFSKPIIAAVDGPAYGAGFSLLLMADLVLMSDRARLCMVFNRIGLLPDMGALYFLPRAVGIQRARELFFSAREISADEAFAMGLALEVTSADELEKRALSVAKSMTGASGSAISLTKAALRSTFQADLSSMLDHERISQAALTESEYFKESMQRFADKRAPQFRWPAKN